MHSIASIVSQIDRLTGVRDVYRTQLSEAAQKLREAEAQVELNSETTKAIRTISEAVQHQAYERIEGLVTHALRFVFEEDYTFRIVTEQKRGKVEATALVERDGVVLDPMRECGGGVVDVCCFALRVVSVTSHVASAYRRVLVLDEPFRFLSASYRPRAAALLENLSDELDFQLIIVTHDSDFHLGEVVRV